METLRLNVMLVCPECYRTVKPRIVARHYVERDTVAVTLPEYPLESGLASTRSIAKLTVGCPIDGCGGEWDVWPDDAGL